MPLLLCPNDNGPMQTVERSGVQFDMCPTCRGVWLDRGELEKLMAASAQEAAAAAPPPPSPQAAPYAPPPRPQAPPQGYNPGYGERGEHGYGGYRKRRGSIFDIFD